MDTRQLLAWAMFIVPGVLPTLGRSKRLLSILAAVAAIVPLWWWVLAFSASDGMSRIVAKHIALLLTATWVFGLAVAILQRIGIARGWAWARFPFPALTALFVLGTLNLLAVGRNFEWL